MIHQIGQAINYIKGINFKLINDQLNIVKFRSVVPKMVMYKLMWLYDWLIDWSIMLGGLIT